MSAGFRGRAAVIGVGVVVPLAALAAFFGVFWDDLPEVVATHWDPRGRADAYVVRGLQLWLTPLILTVGSWGLLSIAVGHVPPQAPGGRWLRALPGGVAWFIVTLACATVLPQRGLPDPQQAPFSNTWMVAGLLGGLVGLGLVLLVTPDTARLPIGPPPVEDELDEPGTRTIRPPTVIWRSSARPPIPAYVGLAVVGILAAAAAVHTRWVIAAVLLTSVIVAAGFTSFRVSIDERSIHVRGTFFGTPRFTVPLSTVSRAEIVEATPLQWGGWGLRYRPTGTGVITRGGKALRLVRTDGSELVFTVDDVVGGAAVVNAARADSP